MAKKKLKLTVYNVKSNDFKIEYLKPKLEERLKNSNVRERRMILNTQDVNEEEDFIPTYKILNDTIYGIKLTMSKSDLALIGEELFDKEEFNIQDISKTGNGIAGTYNKHHYFALNNEYLIISSARFQLKPFQTYINWLLEASRDALYAFEPKINKSRLKLSNIKAMTIGDVALGGVQKSNDNNQTNTTVQEIAINKLSNILDSDIPQDALEQIIEAKLVLKFKKPKSLTEEEYENQFGAVLKSTDTDDVQFKSNDGRTISGTNLLEERVVDFVCNSSKQITNEEVYQEMEKILKELVL